MKNATHLKLPDHVKVAAKVRALKSGRTLTQYLCDLIETDVAASDLADRCVEAAKTALANREGAK
jgi:hypothetical protein